MLTTRVIPVLLLCGPGLVKGERFNSWRRIGPVLPMVRVYESRQVDEMILLDIAATPEGRGPDLATIADVADECFFPLTVGGGVRDLETIRELLRVGADKVAINSAAFDYPSLINEAAEKFGSQCITVSIDVIGMAVGKPRVATHCGQRIRFDDPVDWAWEAAERGAGEILLTSVERDGTMEGYDLGLIRDVSAAVSIPVIASGGARDYADFAAAFDAGAHAVAASALYQFTDATPLGAKRHLAEQGISVRL